MSPGTICSYWAAFQSSLCRLLFLCFSNYNGMRRGSENTSPESSVSNVTAENLFCLHDTLLNYVPLTDYGGGDSIAKEISRPTSKFIWPFENWRKKVTIRWLFYETTFIFGLTFLNSVRKSPQNSPFTTPRRKAKWDFVSDFQTLWHLSSVSRYLKVFLSETSWTMFLLFVSSSSGSFVSFSTLSFTLKEAVQKLQKWVSEEILDDTMMRFSPRSAISAGLYFPRG